MRFFCVRCQKDLGEGYQPFCPCGGMSEVAYDCTQIQFQDSDNPYVRYRGLLPLRERYDSLPADARFTPTVHAKALGRLLGMPHLYLKDETVLPTCSTKDRMAAIALAYLWERGVREFCTSSTGNSSTAYARAIRFFPDMKLYLFTAENFLPRVHYADHDQVVHFALRGASFVDAFDFAGIYARDHGLISERGFFNIGRREGLKLAFLEASEQIPRPIDWYVQAVSSAMGVYGCYKGAKELLALKKISRLPRLLCAQQESCSPMVRAFAAGSLAIRPEDVVPRPAGIAEAILRGDPTKAYPLVRDCVVESGGDMVSVSESEIREARQMVEELEGLHPCFSASTAVAAVIKRVRAAAFPVNDTVMINLTGADRSPAETSGTVRWVERVGDAWQEAS